MKRYAAVALVALSLGLAATPCHAQLLQKLQETVLGGGQNQIQNQQGFIPGQTQQQGYFPGQNGQGLPPAQTQPQGFLSNFLPAQQSQSNLVGNVNLAPGQYMITNTQTGQAFYVVVQNGQMILGQQQSQFGNGGPGQFGQGQAPQQGGLFPQTQQGGVGGLLKNGINSYLQNKMTPQQTAPAQQPF